MRLNLGCGSDIIAGYVNVDMVQTAPEVVTHDLDVAPWPWETGSCELICALDVFEHVDKPLVFMNEAWRVLQVGGVLQIRTPHYTAEHAFTDPTHRRFPTQHTWDYWIPGTVLYSSHHAAYGPAEFERVDTIIVTGTLHVVLRKVMQPC